MRFLSLIGINVRHRSNCEGVAPPGFYSSPEWTKDVFYSPEFFIKLSFKKSVNSDSASKCVDLRTGSTRWCSRSPRWLMYGSLMYLTEPMLFHSSPSSENSPSDPCDHFHMGVKKTASQGKGAGLQDEDRRGWTGGCLGLQVEALSPPVFILLPSFVYTVTVVQNLSGYV